MSTLKIQHVVSFSSEDPASCAENLLDGGGKGWLCKEPGESPVFVILQLEKASKISSVDIGNNGSAFVEVLVGRSGMSAEQYQVLVVSSSFMSPIESRNGTNTGRVRMFGEDKLNKTAVTEKWDHIKVVCTQPFNKHVRFGIAFITLQGKMELDKKEESGTSKIGRFVIHEDDDEAPITVGSLFARSKHGDKESKNSQPFKGAAAVRDADSSLAAAVLANASKVSPPTRRSAERNSFERKDERRSESSKKDERGKRQTEETRRRDSGDWRRDEKKADKKDKEGRDFKKEAEKKTKEVAAKVMPNRKDQKTLPFKQLLNGVVLVISGYQNPLRGNLRSKALEMGARYKPDWDSRCTHLICAFANTPKFHQVKGRGKIVKMNWIEDCYSQRKRLPWRRYALDPSDGGSESEEEVCELVPDQKRSDDKKQSINMSSPKKVSPRKDPDKSDNAGVSNKTEDSDEDDYGGSTDVDTDQDTDDEIRGCQNQKAVTSHAKTEDSSATEFEDDEPQTKKRRKLSEKENLDTHNESEILPPLADFLENTTIGLDPSLDSQLSRQLFRYVTAYKGKVTSSPKERAEYYITEDKNGSTPVAKWKVTPSWLWACNDAQKLVDPEPYAVS